MLGYFFKEAVAGIWPLLWSYGLGGFCIIACVAWAWFMPVFKTTALWVAGGIAVGLVMFTFGVRDGENRVQSKWDVERAAQIELAGRARRDAEQDIGDQPAGATDRRVRDDPYNRDRH